MSNVPQVVSNWITAHPIAVTFVLFAIGILVSLYSSEIKRFLHGWTKRKWRDLNRKQAANTLALLRRVHNNSYEFLLYIFGRLAHLITQAVWMNLALLAFAGFTHASLGTSMWSIFGGLLIGWAYQLKELIKSLYNYEKSVKYWEDELAKYDEPPTPTIIESIAAQSDEVPKSDMK